MGSLRLSASAHTSSSIRLEAQVPFAPQHRAHEVRCFLRCRVRGPYELSRSVSCRGVRTSKLSWSGSIASRSRSPVTIASAPLEVASATR